MPDPAHTLLAEPSGFGRSEEHTSELQSLTNLVCRPLLEKNKPQTLTRQVDMDVKPSAIATSVSLGIAQRWARRLCAQCKTSFFFKAEAPPKDFLLSPHSALPI